MNFYIYSFISMFFSVYLIKMLILSNWFSVWVNSIKLLIIIMTSQSQQYMWLWLRLCRFLKGWLQPRLRGFLKGSLQLCLRLHVDAKASLRLRLHGLRLRTHVWNQPYIKVLYNISCRKILIMKNNLLYPLTSLKKLLKTQIIKSCTETR